MARGRQRSRAGEGARATRNYKVEAGNPLRLAAKPLSAGSATHSHALRPFSRTTVRASPYSTSRFQDRRDRSQRIFVPQRIPPVLLRHKDPLASVTTVLNRLVEYGEARTVVRENGRRAWEWVADPADSGFAASRSGFPASTL